MRAFVLLFLLAGCRGDVSGPGFCQPQAIPVDDPSGVIVQACWFDPLLCRGLIPPTDSVRIGPATPTTLGQTPCDRP